MKTGYWHSGVSSEDTRTGLKPDTRNLKLMLGEGFITPDNVQKKSYFQSKLVRFAHNWNNGMVESWNDGFKENKTKSTTYSALIFIF